MRKKAGAVVAILLFVSLHVGAATVDVGANPVVVDEGLNQPINQNSRYFVDSSSSMKISEVIQKLPEFKKVKTNNLVLSPEPQTIWSFVSFDNVNEAPQKIFINFAPSYLGKIDIYNADSKELVSQSGTLREPTKDTRSGGMPASIVLPSGSTSYFIRLESVGVGLAMEAYSASIFEDNRSRNQMIFSFVVGALMILGFYQLFIFVTSKDLLFLHYVLYIFSMVFFQLGITGYNRYVFPVEVFGFPYGYLGSLLAGNITILFLTTFTYRLLELKNKHWAMKRPFEIIIIGAVVATGVLLFSQSYVSIIMTRLLGVSMVVAAIVVSSILSFRKNYTALFYLISWAPILVGTIIMILNLSGVIEKSVFASWALPFGSVLESLLLALAIGNRLQKVTMEKIHEQSLRIEAYQQIEENFEKMKARDKIIKTYVSPSILTELALGRDPIQYPPQHIMRAILFTDIRNYTGLTEKNTSEEAFEFLNFYFQTLNTGIFNNKGEVDKLIGDAVMATFKEPVNCLEAYSDFRKEFYRFNKSRRDKDLPGIRFGAGVSFGEVLSANFGSQHKLDRTIVGDEVNVASRYESLTKIYKVNLLATPKFLEKLGGSEFSRCIDFVSVKGKAEPRKIIEVFNDSPENVKEFKVNTRDKLEEVVSLKKNKEYAAALKLINELIDECPSHNYDEGLIMDQTLEVLRTKIIELENAEMGSKNGRSAA